MPRSGIAGPYVSSVCLRKLHTVCPSWLHQLTFLGIVPEGSFFLTSLNDTCHSFFDDGLSDKCEVISHCGFELPFPGV